MNQVTREQLWALVDGLDALPSSRELEIEQLMACDGLDRDEAELVVDARRGALLSRVPGGQA